MRCLTPGGEGDRLYYPEVPLQGPLQQAICSIQQYHADPHSGGQPRQNFHKECGRKVCHNRTEPIAQRTRPKREADIDGDVGYISAK